MVGSLGSVAQWVGNVLYAVLAVTALVIWYRRRTPASRWVAAAFGVLALVVLAGLLLPDQPEGLLADLAVRIQVLGLLAFPYLLYRFTTTFEPAGRLLRTVAGSGAAALAVVTLTLPTLDSDAWWLQAYALAFTGLWALLFAAVAFRLARGSRGQPTLARRRMWLLGAGAVLMGLALVVSVAAGTGDADATGATVAAQLLGAGSAGLFLIGFAPPGSLRVAWRQPEERALARATRALLAARDEQQVVDTLLPHVASMVTATTATLEDDTGRIIGSYASAVEADAAEVIRLPVRDGELRVTTSAYTPFFGVEEQLLLRRLALLAELALDRIALVEELRTTNLALESANAELEAFVYSASHDLKNPLIALLGYLEVLRGDYGESLDEQGRWYLERMVVNGRFMESLIGDLLELSRVGRAEAEPTEVDLAEMVVDIAGDLASRHPGVSVHVGDLPTIWFDRTHARQLFANLLENAARYGGRDELTVRLTSRVAGGRLHIHVADDGVGIPEEHRERVFGVFERHVAGDDKTSGTGIGLAICRKIVELREGTIRFAPAEVGADVEIVLPGDVVSRRREAAEEPSGH